MTGDLLVSPFSNSTIRDWPATHFSTLLGLLREILPDALIRVTGTRSQWFRGAGIVRAHDPRQVTNDCGRFSWPEMVERIRRARCVIGNNSGIAHLAASLEVPTVCIFGGSHQRLEWYPSGARAVIVSREIACSPCHLDHGAACPYNKACLSSIEPRHVAEAVRNALDASIAADSKTGDSL